MTEIKTKSKPIFNFWQLALSYLIPLKIEEKDFPGFEKLQLVLSRGETYLYTTDAIYSNGLRYRPFKKTLKKIYTNNPKPKSFLLLGAGLGAGLKQLQRHYGAFPDATLVDTNPTIIEWAKKYTDLNKKNNVEWKLESAQNFVKSCPIKYDLIAVDAFHKLDTRSFVFEMEFLKDVIGLLKPEGWIIFNVILSNKELLQSFYSSLTLNFAHVEQIDDGINYYFILREAN